MKFGLMICAILIGVLSAPAYAEGTLSFGDDLGDYANDGECDDPRFDGPGMTGTTLLSDDVLHDATDCRAAFKADKLTLRGVASDGTVDFGDDNGDYSNDGECDDLRFTGPGMTTTALVQADIMHDASDCRAAYKAGRLELHFR
jgi:hypothetical protein